MRVRARLCGFRSLTSSEQQAAVAAVAAEEERNTEMGAQNKALAERLSVARAEYSRLEGIVTAKTLRIGELEGKVQELEETLVSKTTEYLLARAAVCT